MIRHERVKPPQRDYPADEWNVIEQGFHPEFMAQFETILALGNGYLGMRGCPEEGGPNAENSTLVNGFYETRPILYGEEAYGFAKTGQTILNVTDSKIIKLFVDDEPFWLPHANLLRYDRRLNMKAGCHIASMGGTWMMLAYGFGGMRDHDGTLSFWPRRAPEENAVLAFHLTWRGQRLEVEIGLEQASYTLREGESLVIHHETEEVRLTQEHRRVVRPISRW